MNVGWLCLRPSKTVKIILPFLGAKPQSLKGNKLQRDLFSYCRAKQTRTQTYWRFTQINDMSIRFSSDFLR